MTRIEIATPTGPGWADVDRPKGGAVSLLVLGHGASGGVEAADLIAVRDAAVAAGIAVVRVTQPYRVSGRRAPAPAPRLDEAWLEIVRHIRRLRGNSGLPFVAGGRSSGARVACRTANDAGAAAVVALAFPLHPPGRPERGRSEELTLPSVPVLVVQGERDAFGMPPAAPGREVVVVPGSDHSLKKDSGAVARAVVGFVLGLSDVRLSDVRLGDVRLSGR